MPAAEQNVDYNGIRFTVAPDTGYSIASVAGSCGGTLAGDIYTTGPITADCNVVASFVINSFAVSPSAGTGGTIDPDVEQNVDYNGNISFTVTPDTGYSIASVAGSCGGTLAGDTYTTGPITADCTVVASFSFSTVVSVTGRVWLDRDLGASRVAQAVDDQQAYGDLYQWGRGADGHQKRDSETTDVLSSTDTPGNDDFILPDSFPYDWRSPKNDDLWQGINGTNNPCPTGFRLPTQAEWQTEIDTWVPQNSVGAFASALKLVVGGFRDPSGLGGPGEIIYAGTDGYFWTSTKLGDNSHYLTIESGGASAASNYVRSSGMSVRCIEEYIFTVTPSVVGSGGSISPDTTQNVYNGQTTSFTLAPDSGYYIGAIDGSCGGRLDGNVYTTNAITADCTVNVSFSDTSYTVRPSVVGDGGSISPDTTLMVGEGGSRLFTVIPDDGYLIASVAGSCGGWLNGTIYTTDPITADCTVEASFNIYDTVVSANNRVWMDRNLGASRVAEAVDDQLAYGDLYQWGRGADGHQKRLSATTDVLSSTDTPGNDDFILPVSSPYDWLSNPDDELWQGTSGVNNPCPSGFRLPTEGEWQTEIESWDTQNSAGAFDSPLKLVVEGYRDSGALGWPGAIFNAGRDGAYWTSTIAGDNSRYLFIDSGNAVAFEYVRSAGMSVRCIEELQLNNWQ